MSKKIFLITLIILVGMPLSATVWSFVEPVKGWYDNENDWFVFEWEREDEGKITSIFDHTNKIVPEIKAKMDFNKNTSDFSYNYSVSNIGGRQFLDTIIVRVFENIYNATSPSDKWYGHWHRYETKDAWQWTKFDEESPGISQGETVKEFSFKSTGIPYIVNATFHGERRVEFSGPGDADTDEVAISFDNLFVKFMKQYPDKFKNVVLRTLGPTAPPAELKPVEFIANLIKMKEEAYTLGWITDKGIEISLDQKLENAKKKLEQGNTGAAKNILDAFINEVEAQGCESYEAECPKGKHLKPEAYALLKYNAKYLIENVK